MSLASYALLHRECFTLFDEEMFADLFTDVGSRSIPPTVVAVVMVLQRIEGLSDREAVDRFCFHELRTTWFPAVPGLVERLEAGVRVADVGCGHGGGPPNVSFLVGDATEPFSVEYDVVVYFDALHDMGDPASALREAYASLCQGGIVLAIEPWSTDRLEDGIGNPLVQLDYALSTSVCTPCALAQQGRHALGNQGGPTPRLELLTAAGFRDPIVAADTGFNLVLAATK